MNKEIYTCDACRYIFEAESGCDQCPDCGKRIHVFGESHLDRVAEKLGLPVLARLPIDPKVAEAYDNGRMESVNTELLSGVVDAIEQAE